MADQWPIMDVIAATMCPNGILTHVMIFGRNLKFNPGALYGADEFTVAILDVETGRVERILVETE